MATKLTTSFWLEKLAGELGTPGGLLSLPKYVQPAVLAALAEKSTSSAGEPSVLLVGVPTISEAESLSREFKAWLGAKSAELLPAWETLPFERVSPAAATMGQRLEVLSQLRSPTEQVKVIVAPTRALIQKIAPNNFDRRELKVGHTQDRDELVKWLVGRGYRREIQVSARGELAVRGAIVDVFTSTAKAPLRMEFFGDTLEAMRTFSLADQLGTGDVFSAQILPAREFLPNAKHRERAKRLAEKYSWGREQFQKLADAEIFEGMESFMGWLTDEAQIPTELASPEVNLVLVEPELMKVQAERLVREEADLASSLMQTWGIESLEQVPRLNAEFERLQTGPALKVSSTAGASPVVSEIWGTTGLALIPKMKKLLAERYFLLITAWSQTSVQNLQASLRESGLDIPIVDDMSANKTPQPVGSSCIVKSDIVEGCIFPGPKIAVLTEAQFTKKRAIHRPERSETGGTSSSAWHGELAPGSYVVHKRHGVGLYAGTETRRIGDVEREYLVIKYKGQDRLYLPAEQIGLLSLHSVGEAPKLNSLGGSGWSKARRKAKAEADQIARELVELYKARSQIEGHSYSSDSEPHKDLAASFPYLETKDQQAAILDTQADMEKAAPMDRLIYGDVGFGKTEVAIRAVFKAIYDGKQAAILAPTTLLARQHFQTFSERYGDFAIKIGHLSRLVSKKEISQIIKAVALGEIDLVIGTHRLLSKDVRFKNLGLLVIDEEQRFGVRHKEKLKEFHNNVDILTLTATPIPRTLEMSLTGIRDYSNIQTPPLERHPILTYVGAYEKAAVSEAIRRELLRDGQVFFVHNRVANIEEVSQELKELVPDARIAAAHGQMNEVQLEGIMQDFTDKKLDVLVCTTIIESGIDMPRVNTLVVNRAEALGLGQLHQLRGRVGRAGVQAYAYLFITPGKEISAEAVERLRTISETTALGSGFQLALRDLEIRGAGNLLGFGQSGHIASVGYDMYCELVAEAVSELTQKDLSVTKKPPKKDVAMDLPLDARLPEDYVSAESLRLDAYRRLFTADLEEMAAIEAELKDRFGPLPEPAKTLLTMAKLRSKCSELGIESLSVAMVTPPTPHKPKYLLARIAPVDEKLVQSLSGVKYFDGEEISEIPEALTYDEGKAALGIKLRNSHKNMAEELFWLLGHLA